MEEILHHLLALKPCETWYILHINWCRISSINSINHFLKVFWYPFVCSHFSLSGSAKCYWLSMAFLELNLGRGLGEPVWVQLNGWWSQRSHLFIFTKLLIYWEISITYPNLWVHLLLDPCVGWWQLKDLLFSSRSLGKISNLTKYFSNANYLYFQWNIEAGEPDTWDKSLGLGKKLGA